MNTRLLSHARQLWLHEHSDPHTARYNAVHWARAVSQLGDRWILHKKWTPEELIRLKQRRSL